LVSSKSKDLGTQLNNFKNVEKTLRSNLGDAEARRVISKAVYLFHIGANDYQYPFFANTSTFSNTTKERFIDFVIGNTTTVIEVSNWFCQLKAERNRTFDYV